MAVVGSDTIALQVCLAEKHESLDDKRTKTKRLSYPKERCCAFRGVIVRMLLSPPAKSVARPP